MVAGQGRLLGSISLFENWRFKFPVLLVGGIEEIRCDFLHLCFFARERDSGAGAGSSSNTCRDALHQWGGGEKNMRERERPVDSITTTPTARGVVLVGPAARSPRARGAGAHAVARSHPPIPVSQGRLSRLSAAPLLAPPPSHTIIEICAAACMIPPALSINYFQ